MQDAQTTQRPSEETPVRARRSSSDDAVAKEQAHLVLDDEGTIQHVSGTARVLLDLGSRSLTGESFFGRVHPRRLKQVLHDLTEMTVHDKQQATWLLHLKTGLGPWQWFKIEAENRLDRGNPSGIVLRLFERGGGYGQR